VPGIKKSMTLLPGCPSLIRPDTINHKLVSGTNDVRGQSNTGGWHQTSVSVGAEIIINQHYYKSYWCQLLLMVAQTSIGILDEYDMGAFCDSIAITLLSLLVQNMEWYFGGLRDNTIFI
jgi:hypothetical protein